MTEPSPTPDPSASQQPAPPLVDPAVALSALSALALAAQQGFGRGAAPERQQNPGGPIPPWLLGLIPVFLACLQLMIVARGDAETLRSLVQNLNVTALLLSTTLPLATTILTWIYFFTLVTRMARPEGERLKGFWRSVVFLIVIAVIDFIAMPADYGTYNLAIFAAFVVSIFVARAANRRPDGGRFNRAVKIVSVASPRIWAAVLLGGPVIIWLCFLGVYLPQERLTIGSVDHEPVYVLSVDDRWTKYMDAAHKVHIVSTPSVQGREMVGTAHSSWRKTPLELTGDWLSRRTRRGSPKPERSTPVQQTPSPGPTVRQHR